MKLVLQIENLNEFQQDFKLFSSKINVLILQTFTKRRVFLTLSAFKGEKWKCFMKINITLPVAFNERLVKYQKKEIYSKDIFLRDKIELTGQ